ncbi:MAG TPA: hypothetical protein PKC12_01160 [Thiobacillaceae bacterium]|nr:hypothetical protein [Thiobacillaceae bacterium]
MVSIVSLRCPVLAATFDGGPFSGSPKKTDVVAPAVCIGDPVAGSRRASRRAGG